MILVHVSYGRNLKPARCSYDTVDDHWRRDPIPPSTRDPHTFSDFRVEVLRWSDHNCDENNGNEASLKVRKTYTIKEGKYRHCY
jgi:hypothetical protein